MVLVNAAETVEEVTVNAGLILVAAVMIRVAVVRKLLLLVKRAVEEVVAVNAVQNRRMRDQVIAVETAEVVVEIKCLKNKKSKQVAVVIVVVNVEKPKNPVIVAEIAAADVRAKKKHEKTVQIVEAIRAVIVGRMVVKVETVKKITKLRLQLS